MTTWPRWWLPTLTAFVLGCLAFLLVPEDSLASVAVYHLVAVSAAVLLLVGTLRLPTASRAVWWAVLVYVVLSELGDIVYDTQAQLLDEPAYPGPADALYLSAYVAAVVVLALIIRRSSISGGLEAWIDTAIISLGAASVVGVLVIEPILVGGEETALAMALSLVYPLLDLVLIAGLVRILVGHGRVNPAIALLTGAFAVTFVADLMFSYVASRGLDQVVPSGLDVLYLVAFSLLALAASAPGADHLVPAAAAGTFTLDARPTAPTAIALAAGALTVPIMLVYTTWSGSSADLVLLSLACILVVTLVLWRFRRLLRVAAAQSGDLARLARTDALTSLPNRRTLDFELQRQADRSREQATGLCVAMLDLDRFKPYNDTHGHQAGDEALAACALAWSAALGPGVFLARYGGEEFVAVLAEHDLDQAQAVLDAARRATPSGLTVSIGVAQRQQDESAADMLLRADRALYRAKEDGRDRIAVSHPED